MPKMTTKKQATKLRIFFNISIKNPCNEHYILKKHTPNKRRQRCSYQKKSLNLRYY
jgi:hypothetical protein